MAAGRITGIRNIHQEGTVKTKMKNPISDYWEECVSNALEDSGLMATPKQIKEIADAMRISHECYRQMFYKPENPLIREVATLKRKLTEEQDKVFCRECLGTGRITSQGPYHSSNSDCMKCRGAGKI
jgi:hypothetical protein